MYCSDVTAVIYHFDITVLQQVYRQYKDFNFFHLFLTSMELLFVSHIINAIYWLLMRQKVRNGVLLCLSLWVVPFIFNVFRLFTLRALSQLTRRGCGIICP